MIQLQGYSSAELASLSYDVSNATGIFTNFTGYVTGEFYDTNLMEFTTNYFQCYDVALTNGLNTITVHAVDVFGQIATTNFNVTLDYSGDTTPPALSVIWPHNGTYISGSSFTFQGSVDDATATVTAQIVDAGGDTNTVQGAVERDGKVSIGNLPVAAGANVLTVTATDAAGNSTTTNLTVTQSGVMVTMDPLSSDQANLSSVSVTGTISDTSSNVCIQVNGTNAYYLDAAGDWEADGVPVNPTGMAAFDVELYTNDPVNIGSQVFVQLQPAFVTLANFKQDSYYADALPEHGKATVHWNYAGGGGWSLDFNAGGYSANASSTLPPDGTNYTLPTVSYGFNVVTVIGSTWLGWTGQFSPAWQNAQNAFDLSIIAFQESVQTTVMIVPSGPKLPGVTKTYNVRACAMSFSDLLHDGDLGTIQLAPGQLADTVGDTPMPPGQLLINGKALVSSGVTNSDGSVWGTNSVSAMAGTLVPLYVTGANNDFTFNAEIVKDKLYWQNLVQAEIDAKSSVVIENYLASRGFMDNRQNIQAVYAFYQNLFVNQTNFLWAGLAKLAGAPVYAGLSDAQQVSTFITNIVFLNELETNINAEEALALETNGVAFIQTFQTNLIQMNIDILSDLAWQFEAYKNGGLAAIQTAYAYGNSDLDPFATNAWGEVDQGIQTSDAASIQDGNEKLLQREQQQILAAGYSKLTAMSNSVTWAMSEFAKNPVPGGPDFISMEPSGSIANYPDRWDWITHPYVSPSNTGMWPLWIGTPVNTQLSWVKVPLTTYATNYAIILPLIQ